MSCKATCLLSASKPGGPRRRRKAYLSVPCSEPLRDETIGELVNESAIKYPDSEAIVVCNPTTTTTTTVVVRKTFRELKSEVDRLAAGLLGIGLEKGDRVGIWGPNSYEWYLTFLAVMKAGLVSVNINPAFKSAELEHCINKVGVKCMVIPAEPFKTSNYYAMMMELCPELGIPERGNLQEGGRVPSSSSLPTLTTLVTMSSSSTPMKGAAYTLAQVLELGSSPEALAKLEEAERMVQPDDICNIQFSSGTTGAPKGIPLSHHNIVNDAYFFTKRFGYTKKDKICLPAPLFHCFGCIAGGLGAICYGAALVLPSSPGFSPTDTLKAISSEGCTAIYAPPTMHIDILHAPNFDQYDVSSLRYSLSGGSICPEQVIRLMRTKYRVEHVMMGFGLTEASGGILVNLLSDSEELRSETVGYPLEHLEVKMVDGDGRVVDVGEQGELCVRGFNLMRGYWEDEEKTKEAIDQSGWFHTGDLAVMLPSGHAQIVGRLKDLIIRGGENIYPREIEDFLHTHHPDVQEVAVFSVPDVRLGEELVACVKLKGGAKLLSEDELKVFCKGKIAHYKIPTHVRFVQEFPKTTSGKILKSKMREAMMLELGI